MLLTLNDDCLYKIMENLELQDFLNLVDVCQELKNFIANRFERCTLGRRSNFTPKFFKQIMENSKGNIQCNAELLYSFKDSLKFLQFPGITSLTLFVHAFEKQEENNLERLIIDNFPNLKCLTVQGNLCLKYISELKNLEKLTVDSNALEKASINQLRTLDLQSLSLKKRLKDWSTLESLVNFSKLQELSFHIYDYIDFVRNYGFKLLLHLKKLTLNNVNKKIFLLLDDSRYFKKIDSLRFNLTIDFHANIFSLFLLKTTKLRHLLIAKDNGSILKLISYANIKFWHTLEEIYYINSGVSALSDINDQSKNLLVMIRHCKNLKKLDISGSAFGIELLQQIIGIIQSQPKRTNKLLICCYNTEIMKNQVLPTLPKNLNLSFGQFDYEVPLQNGIEIGFEEEHSIDDMLKYADDIMTFSRVDDARYILNVFNEELNKYRYVNGHSGIILDEFLVVAETMRFPINMLTERALRLSVFENA